MYVNKDEVYPFMLLRMGINSLNKFKYLKIALNSNSFEGVNTPPPLLLFLSAIA